MNRKTKVHVAVVTCVVLALALTACSSGATEPNGISTGSDTSGALTISEEGLAFSPDTLEVKVGDSVTFTNKESVPHNVNIDGADLGEQAQGQSVTWTASKAGAFPFTCTIHPSMTGEITVK